MPTLKVIAVIGATGAQGLPTVRQLLMPSRDGAPSPWKVRALTRDPTHKRARELEALGVQLVVGSFLDPAAIHQLFDGVYGAFVNTDGFTVGSAAETDAAFNIWEVACLKKVRHFVWSNLDYSLQLANYNELYACDHHNAKGRFADFLGSQPNSANDEHGTMWTVFTNGPYMEMLHGMLSPFNVRPDGTRVFVAPIGDTGTIPLIALNDLAWWVRYIFDNAPSTTGKNLEVASQVATFPEIVETFMKVTGLPAQYKALSMDEYFALWNGDKIPVASEVPDGKTWESNFRAFFATWRDNVVKRDMEWIASVHPPTTLEKWMRDTGYTGLAAGKFLKNTEDRRTYLTRIRGKLAKL